MGSRTSEFISHIFRKLSGERGPPQGLCGPHRMVSPPGRCAILVVRLVEQRVPDWIQGSKGDCDPAWVPLRDSNSITTENGLRTGVASRKFCCNRVGSRRLPQFLFVPPSNSHYLGPSNLCSWGQKGPRTTKTEAITDRASTQKIISVLSLMSG